MKFEFANKIAGAMQNGSAVANAKLEELRASAVSRSDALNPGPLDVIFDNIETVQTVSSGFAGAIIDMTRSKFQRFSNNNFNKLKSILGNKAIGKIIIGKIVASVVQAGSRFGQIVLVICAFLSLASEHP